MYSRRGTCFTATPPTLSPIAGTPGTTIAVTASTSTGSIRVYLAMAISARINIVYKQITDIAKDIQAIDRQFNKFEDSLNEIKDELTFLRHSIIVLIYNAGLPDIEYG